jgi:hypothetical protein
LVFHYRKNIVGVKEQGAEDLRGRKRQEVGEDFIMRSFITCMIHQVTRVIK